MSVNGNCQVDFNLIIGVGRSSTSIPAFEHFKFDVPTGTVGTLLWSTSSAAPPRDNTAATPAANFVNQIVAQDIQLDAQVSYNPGSPVSAHASVQLIAYFAPKTHVRPEWFTKVGLFPGAEGGQ
jgi:hypothetical protein